MANLREIQGRMKSIQDTMKITNAMYMISSTKLRKAKKNLEEMEPYFFTLQHMMAQIMHCVPEMEHPFFDTRAEKPEEERTRGVIVVTADKGLAGAYNHNVLKLAHEQIDKPDNCRLFVVGELGRQYFAARHIPVAEQFYYTAQNPSLHRARVISEKVLKEFLDGKLDDVEIIYTGMKGGITTETEVMHLLPLVMDAPPEQIADLLEDVAQEKGEEMVLKPTPKDVLNNIIPDMIMGFIYGALVESFCSEQNARMVAMEAANKNAGAMIHDLSIQYNRVRQSMITQEITEVIAGARAQKKKKARKEA